MYVRVARKLITTFPDRSIFTRNHLDIAHFASPSGRTVTMVSVLLLSTMGTILTRLSSTPINKFIAVFSFESIWTVTSVVMQVVRAGSSVSTRIRVALVNPCLTIRTGISENYKISS